MVAVLGPGREKRLAGFVAGPFFCLISPPCGCILIGKPVTLSGSTALAEVPAPRRAIEESSKIRTPATAGSMIVLPAKAAATNTEPAP